MLTHFENLSEANLMFECASRKIDYEGKSISDMIMLLRNYELNKDKIDIEEVKEIVFKPIVPKDLVMPKFRISSDKELKFKPIRIDKNAPKYVEKETGIAWREGHIYHLICKLIRDNQFTMKELVKEIREKHGYMHQDEGGMKHIVETLMGILGSNTAYMFYSYKIMCSPDGILRYVYRRKK